MNNAYPETEITGAESDAGALKEEQGGATAAEPAAAGAARGRRTEKPKPRKAGSAQKEETVEGSPAPDRGAQPSTSKLDRLVALLRAPEGATLPELSSATGWQLHSVRGAMAGALRKKGHSVISEKPADGLRRYRIEEVS